MVTVDGQSVKIRGADLQTSCEEADTIVVQQVINVAQAGGTGVQITVRADDTDCVPGISTTSWIVYQTHFLYGLSQKRSNEIGHSINS